MFVNFQSSVRAKKINGYAVSRCVPLFGSGKRPDLAFQEGIRYTNEQFSQLAEPKEMIDDDGIVICTGECWLLATLFCKTLSEKCLV